MKIRHALLGALLAVGLAIGCTSADKVDPTSNVSVGDMRAGLVRTQDNVWGNVYPAIAALASEDLASEKPKHTAMWWKAKLALLSATATLISDTLTGATK